MVQDAAPRSAMEPEVEGDVLPAENIPERATNPHIPVASKGKMRK